MQTIPKIDLQVLPENAQQEVYDFYLFVKQRIKNHYPLNQTNSDITNKQSKILDKLNALKVDKFTPLSRDEIYDR